MRSHPDPPARTLPELAGLPDSGVVHLWSIPQCPASAHPNLLSPDEAAQRDRFRFARDQERFQVTRSAIRTILSTYLAVQPEELTFHRGPHGKPTLRPPHEDIHFNLSHSGGWSLLAVTTEMSLGVDLELHQEDLNPAELAPSILSTVELAGFNALSVSDQVASFLFHWTVKESYLKSLGTGLSLDPKKTEVSPHTHDPNAGTVRTLGLQDESRQHYQVLPFAPGYSAALCSPSPPTSLQTYAY